MALISLVLLLICCHSPVRSCFGLHLREGWSEFVFGGVFLILHEVLETAKDSLDVNCTVQAVDKRHLLMRVIPMISSGSGFKLVHKGVSWVNGRLTETRHTI